MPNRIYVALAGKAQHGKSTLARELTRHFHAQGKTVQVTSFATTPKNMLSALGLSWEQLYGSEKETPTAALCGKTPRFAMQSLATEWGRKMLSNDIWVRAWRHSMNSLANDVQVIIVDDLRHLPELEELHNRCAYIVQVVNPSKLPKTRVEKLKAWFKQLKAHSSEKLDFDFYGVEVLLNDSTPQEMVKKFLEIHPVLK